MTGLVRVTPRLQDTADLSDTVSGLSLNGSSHRLTTRNVGWRCGHL